MSQLYLSTPWVVARQAIRVTCSARVGCDGLRATGRRGETPDANLLCGAHAGLRFLGLSCASAGAGAIFIISFIHLSPSSHACRGARAQEDTRNRTMCTMYICVRSTRWTRCPSGIVLRDQFKNLLAVAFCGECSRRSRPSSPWMVSWPPSGSGTWTRKRCTATVSLRCGGAHGPPRDAPDIPHESGIWRDTTRCAPQRREPA